MGWDEIGSGRAGQAIGNVADYPAELVANVKRQVLKSVEFSSSVSSSSSSSSSSSKERALDSVMAMVR
ncbi:hypothetical protein EAF00_009637 [Botryotinia globosa]|nr:hypothetical protein EAF00_009637 [Botryotinia globosa]